MDVIFPNRNSNTSNEEWIGRIIYGYEPWINICTISPQSVKLRCGGQLLLPFADFIGHNKRHTFWVFSNVLASSRTTEETLPPSIFCFQQMLCFDLYIYVIKPILWMGAIELHPKYQPLRRDRARPRTAWYVVERGEKSDPRSAWSRRWRRLLLLPVYKKTGVMFFLMLMWKKPTWMKMMSLCGRYCRTTSLRRYELGYYFGSN